MKKKLFCIGLGVVLAVSALGFTACGGDDKAELQKQLSAMQTTVERQETEISELKKDKEELQKQNDELNERIEELEERIEDLEAAGIHGAFYWIGEAYENGWLTKEDIMHIAYFSEGVVNELDENGDKKPIEFTPSIPEPVLSKSKEKALIEAYYQFTDYTSGVKLLQYLGCYNGNYVCIINGPGYGAAGTLYVHIAGIYFRVQGPGAWVFHVSND